MRKPNKKNKHFNFQELKHKDKNFLKEKEKPLLVELSPFFVVCSVCKTEKNLTIKVSTTNAVTSACSRNTILIFLLMNFLLPTWCVENFPFRRQLCSTVLGTTKNRRGVFYESKQQCENS